MTTKPLIRSRIARLLSVAWIIPATMACGNCEGDYQSSAKFNASANHLTLDEDPADAPNDAAAHEITDEEGARSALVELVRHTPRMEAVYNELSKDACDLDFETAAVYETSNDPMKPWVVMIPMHCQSEPTGSLRVDISTDAPMQPIRASVTADLAR
jgi:hypothetical protein